MEFFSLVGCSFCIIVLLFSLLFIWFMFRADADVTLLFYEMFGGKPQFLNQVVWITGASSGIGEYLAYDFTSLGAKLALSGTNVEELNRVKRNCLDRASIEESDILILPFLIEDFTSHDDKVKKVFNHFGHIDILVNNAGVSQRADFQDIDIEVDQKLFNVNVFGSVNLTRKVLPYFMEKNKGQIVVTSSLAGKIGAPNSSSYTGSKHALHGYFEAVRTEMIQKNISVTLICPGPVFSNITSRCLARKLGEIFDEKPRLTDNKMQTDRCSHLMAIAIAHQLDESWICLQPLLLLYYLSQYTPSFFRSIILKKFFTKGRAQSMRKGQN